MRNVFSGLVYVALVSFLAAAAGCRRAEGPPPEKARRTTIGFSLPSLEGFGNAQLAADVKAAVAKRPGLDYAVLDAGNDSNKQQDDLEVLAKSCGVVVVVPLDPHETTETVEKLSDAGVPVIVLNRAIIGDKFACYIAPDWKQIGSAAADWLAGKLGGKGKIVEIKGPVDAIHAGQMHDGFRARLRDPGFRFVFEGFLDPPRVDGCRLMADAMADVDRFDAVFAFDDAAALSARRAAEAAGRADGVLFVGVGGAPDGGAKFVKDGLLGASVFVPTGGAEAVETAAIILAGGTAPKRIVPPPRMLSE